MQCDAEGLLALAKDPPVLALPVGHKVSAPNEPPSQMNGDVRAPPLSSSQFVSYIDPCAGNANLGSPSWGLCNVGNVNVLGMGGEQAQLQSKRLQQAMAMRASFGSTPVSGHGKKVCYGRI